MINQNGQILRETLACLILDDPLLIPRYGCMDYTKLLEEMNAHNFFTEIAFIPWNYKRSDPKTVRLFADNVDRYAICVHGCNHSGNEFGGDNYRELSELSSVALWRMEQHKKLTGLSYDPVFVFPHGRFSSVAVLALKHQGFFAAFNTTIQSTDGEEPQAEEYRRPATMMYHDFPLFLRRNPSARSHFAEDVSMGRPIIIVAHHGDFRDGYRMITDLVDWINSLGNIRWTSLLNIAEHYLGKRMADTKLRIDSSQLHLSVNAKAILRRFLSEARDNYVETSNFLNKGYKKLRGLYE